MPPTPTIGPDRESDAHGVLRMTQWVPLPREDLFPFFADPANLERITPPWLHFSVRGASTAEVGEGTVIDYRLRLHGLPLRWQSRIEDWRPPEAFVDTQLRGPYVEWHHLHTFTPADGGTRLDDRVRFRVPGGRLGWWLAGWKVRRDLRRIFSYRARAIAERFGGPAY